MTTHYIAYEGHGGVALAAIQRDYLQYITTQTNNAEVTEGILARTPITLEQEEEWFAQRSKKSPTDEIFAILYKAEEEYRFVGLTGIHTITWPDAFATFGIVILDPSLHGKGVGTEACMLLHYHSFFVKGLRKVIAEVKGFNGKSFGHLCKSGYQISGRYKNHRFHKGGFVDLYQLEVFREEFDPIWNQYQETKLLPKLNDEVKAKIKAITES